MIDTLWKIINELLMYAIWPLAAFYLKINGVAFGKGCKFYGIPMVFRTRGSKIIIGNNFEARSWWFSNPLGINHPLILCTWSKKAEIVIGNDVGISGGSIVAAEKIEIGDETLVGVNSTIIDTDFHPLKGLHRRYDKRNIKTFPVKIGKNVFVGMNSIILKGANISDNSIIPAGGIVRHDSK
jgi:acetyltransferase-like isoleucine patch superfamily enzyme